MLGMNFSIIDGEVSSLKRYIKSTINSGMVGIWWIYKDSVVADIVSLENGYNDGYFIHYDERKNHASEWKTLMLKNGANEDEIKKGYRSIERGRVVFNLRTQSYEIVCSEDVSKSSDILRKISDAFNLAGCRVDVVVDTHYRLYEYGSNPALDEFDTLN